MKKMFFGKKLKAVAIIFAVVFLLSSGISVSKPTTVSANPVVSTDWFKNGGYGVSVHWTSLSVPSSGGSPAAFCTAVNNFDETAFANQLADAGASYVIFTVGHAETYLPFPSATMDAEISGRTCTRDLPSDIYDEISPKGIGMIFYYPSQGEWDIPWGTASLWGTNDAHWAQLQYDLVTEFGNRYGDKLAGWWLDNMYDGGWGSKYNYSTYASALRSGYSDRMIAFNFSSISTGSNWSSTTGAGIADYQGGESNDMNRLPSSRYAGEGGTQWQTWTYLDDFWWHSTAGTPTPRYSDNKVILYAKSVINGQGVLTLNAAPYQDTLISSQTMSQLGALKSAVRGSSGSTSVIDDRDAGITYSGSWSLHTADNDHLGTSTYTTSSGAYAEYSFTGTAVKWYGVKGDDHGKADVYIDGTFDETIDEYSASRQDVALLYSKTGLAANTQHTIKIVQRSDKNASSSGYYTEMDAIEYQTGTRVDDQSGSITYSGSWNNTTGPLYMNGTGKYTTSSGDYAQYTFSGTKISLYGVMGSDHGKVDIYLDTVFQTTVDLYQNRWTAGTLLYSATGLSNTSHTIKMVVRSDKNAASSGYFAEVDAFEY